MTDLTEVLIIGGGMAGLFSACLTTNLGLSTTVVMRGRGGLSLSHGAIELIARASPSRSISRLAPPHPYALAGKRQLIEGLKEFSEITAGCGLSFSGGRSSNFRLLMPSGNTRFAAFVPPGFIDTDQTRVSLGSFTVIRDFWPDLAYACQGQGGPIKSVVELPLLPPLTSQTVYPHELARAFDDFDWAAENVRAWKPHLIGVKRLGLPAVLGLSNHTELLEVLQELLSIPVFEIPTLPPSVPGLRLEHALRTHALDRGAVFIEGPKALGRVQHKNGSVRAAGAVLESAGKPRALDARFTILATGSILHGGIVTKQNGMVTEQVFNLPVKHSNDRTEWINQSALHSQAYSQYGISVNDRMQPLDIHSEPMMANLYAAGGIIGGSDRTLEGSRQGIDIATAYCAVDQIRRCIT